MHFALARAQFPQARHLVAPVSDDCESIANYACVIQPGKRKVSWKKGRPAKYGMNERLRTFEKSAFPVRHLGQ